MMRRQAAAVHSRAKRSGEVVETITTPPAKLPLAASAIQVAAEEEATHETAGADEVPTGGKPEDTTVSPDADSEMVNVWLVGAEANLVEVLPEEERGTFWSANAYIVLYSYTVKGADRSVLYFWKGADVTQINFLTWRFQLSRLLQKMPGTPVPRVCNRGGTGAISCDYGGDDRTHGHASACASIHDATSSSSRGRSRGGGWGTISGR